MYVNHGSAEDKVSNCAMCTIAAIVGTDTGRIAKVLEQNGQSDAHLARGFNVAGMSMVELPKVLQKMMALVKQMKAFKNTKVNCEQFGFPDGYRDLSAIRGYMQTKKVGTQFAVWGYLTGEVKGLGAHWNFATTAGVSKIVEFRDYQDNVSDAALPATSPSFLAPLPDRAESAKYNSFIVLCFEAE